MKTSRKINTGFSVAINQKKTTRAPESILPPIKRMHPVSRDLKLTQWLKSNCFLVIVNNVYGFSRFYFYCRNF